MEKNKALLVLILVAVVWISIYVMIYLLLWKQCYQKGKLVKLLDFMSGSKVFKSAVLLLSFLFPLQINLALNNPGIINVLDFMWIGFYSCLFVCISYEKPMLRVITISLNIGYSLLLIYGFLLEGIEQVPLLLLKIVVPFIKVI